MWANNWLADNFWKTFNLDELYTSANDTVRWHWSADTLFDNFQSVNLSICVKPGCGSRKSIVCAWNTHIWLVNLWPSWVVIAFLWTRSCWSCFSSCTSSSSPSSLSSDQIGLLSWLPDSHNSCNRESNFANSLHIIGVLVFWETCVAREDEGCWTCEKLSASGGENRLAMMGGVRELLLMGCGWSCGSGMPRGWKQQQQKQQFIVPIVKK